MAKVALAPNGCLEWQGGRYPNGYGSFSYGGRNVLAHRWIDAYANGPHRPGEQSLHTCDNPPCVRLSHLFRGTARDNAQDAAAKGRVLSQTRPGVRAGEANGRAKLSAAQVAEIRAEYDGTRGQLAALARRYGVSRPMLGYIVRGKNW